MGIILFLVACQNGGGFWLLWLFYIFVHECDR